MGQNLEGSALSTAAEVGLKSQLDSAETIDVTVEAHAGQLVQGQLESVEIDGSGLVMKGDLRIEELHLETDAIAIDPLRAAFGKIELTRSTHASTEVVLTEDDMNKALASDYLRQKMQAVPLVVEGQTKTAQVLDIAIRLLGEGKVFASALIQLSDEPDSRQVSFTTQPVVRPDGQGVVLRDIEYKNEPSLPPEMTRCLAEQAARLLNFSNFALDGMTLLVEELRIEQTAIRMAGAAQIDEFPG